MLKKKKKDHWQFDLEAQEKQPLMAIEEEIHVLKEGDNDDLKTSLIETADIDSLFNRLILNNQKINHFLSLIKKNPKPKLEQKIIIKLASNLLVGLGCSGGFGYLVYDFVNRWSEKIKLEDLWDNLIVEDSFTCSKLNGHAILDPNYTLAEACKGYQYRLISGEVCRSLHEKYCDEAVSYRTYSEGAGVFIVICILLCLLATLLYYLYNLLKPCHNLSSYYDNQPIDQILTSNRLSQLKRVTSQNKLSITEKMKRIDVLNNIEHFLSDDISFIKSCLEMKKYAHYLFYIKENLHQNYGYVIPEELLQWIFLYIIENKPISSSDKQEKGIELIEVETEKEGEKETEGELEARDKLTKNCLNLDEYRQSKQLKTDMFGRFFNRAKIIPFIHPENPGVHESNILQVFK